MVHVAKEMEREGFSVPLLIGGATTSRAHTAVKIAPGYRHPVVHVLDASRAVGVVSSLSSKEHRPAFARKNCEEQEKLRQQYSGPRIAPLVSLQEARARRAPIDWTNYQPPRPPSTGSRVWDGVPLRKLVPLIDWTPFFHAWELRGIYPRILHDPVVGPRAQELLDDAKKLLDEIVDEKQLTARAVAGFFPANSVGDDIELYADEARTRPLATFFTLRQQMEKPDGEPEYALADFVAPKETGLADYLGAFAVTAGIGAAELAARFEKAHDDYNAIMVKALADRLAEALAEWMHKQARDAWGFGREENLTPEDLLRERYRGIRPAPGYPASPDHTEKATLFTLLDAERSTGITLTENFAMLPAASICGLYFSHPQSRYFAVGRIGRDQVLDYQRRKGLELRAIERWLGPYLNYERAAD
jgi:5-methyltetrahydrofolate--homocysteine methyltransferase